MIRAALFDLDATLIDSSDLIAQAMAATLAERGHETTEAVVAASTGPPVVEVTSDRRAPRRQRTPSMSPHG